MRRLFHRVGVVLLLVAGLTGAGMGLSSSPFINCAFADEGCGEGSNECEYECNEAQTLCWPSSHPLDFCACEAASTCWTERDVEECQR